jgi:hypothetical protein
MGFDAQQWISSNLSDGSALTSEAYSRVSQPTRLGFQRSFAAWLSIKSLAITSARKSPIRTSALRQ